ncbi:MAG TPA: SPOR domain-containing protein [Kofleriaceae bacterium]|nr:SPOR domain-containing protein [Kofleriaceae bacterium]
MAPREGELFVEKVEVNLDGRQIFCLFCGGAVIASLVFVLGVTVGRRVEAREHVAAIAGSSTTTDPLAALDQLAAEEGAAGPELAFASTLRGERDGDPLGAVDLSLDRPAPRSDGDRAEGKAPEDRPEPKPEAKPEPKPEAKPEVKAETKPEAKPEAKPEVKAETKPEQPTVAARAAQPAPEAAPAQVPAGSARFTLHLSSFQARGEADDLVSRLKKAGYQPYVVESVEEGKGTWYRVRVGYFGDYEGAVAGKTDFEKKQNIIAYVTRTKR